MQVTKTPQSSSARWTSAAWQKSSEDPFAFPTLAGEQFPGTDCVLQPIGAVSIWQLTGHCPFFLDGINLTPQWIQVQTADEQIALCCCTSVWLLSSLGSDTGNISSFFSAMKTFTSTCFAFLYCSLAKPSWQHGCSLSALDILLGQIVVNWLVVTLVTSS